MNPKLKRILLLSAILVASCCIISIAVLLLFPTEEPSTSVAQSAATKTTVPTAELESNSTHAAPTDSPVRSRATAEEQASETPKATNTRQVPTTAFADVPPTLTRRPTNTPMPTRTRRPTATATQAPSPTTVPSTTPTSIPTATLLPGEVGIVTAVIDGDTIIVDLNGTSYRVRYIGIDTPETGDVCGSEATSANAALVGGQTVRMVKDVSETDRYNRLLRYVYVGDTFVNGVLVANGWARAVDYPPDTAMATTLHGLAAQGVGRGCALVAASLPTSPPRAPVAPVVPAAPATTAPPAQPVPQPTAPSAGGNCHPSYPTVCIPPPPPDLDCKDIPHKRFQVIGDDPHGFDRDHDGIGCES